MGYTHYWTQTRDLTRDEWKEVRDEIAAILSDVENVQGVPLADGGGEARTRPLFTDSLISFNGLGDDAHETFQVHRVRTAKESWQSCRGTDFCKTARKPYDLAVTACLAYLATVRETHRVTSDGVGADWLAGVEEARRALPRYANVLDIPMPLMQSDRWCGPWVRGQGGPYEVNFCIDGCGYVMRPRTGESYCFETHRALAQFLDRTKRAVFSRGASTGFGRYDAIEENIWGASGCFDKARHDRIARAQNRALAPLFPVDPSCARQPPSHVRPGQMPPLERTAYSFSEILDPAA